MLLIVDSTNRALEHKAMRTMFEARKRVFIDLLKWDIPALADRFELDQFDNVDATYLIVTDPDGEHLA
ncbi:MAG TPA: acyl-homoserine-lactone synthase, partial [Sphingomicrobium sp.]|nr:acyl-homoserine-lactone synthase [Sphingomicrobium sp.]